MFATIFVLSLTIEDKKGASIIDTPLSTKVPNYICRIRQLFSINIELSKRSIIITMTCRDIQPYVTSFDCWYLEKLSINYSCQIKSFNFSPIRIVFTYIYFHRLGIRIPSILTLYETNMVYCMYALHIDVNDIRQSMRATRPLRMPIRVLLSIKQTCRNSIACPFTRRLLSICRGSP